MNLTNIIKLIEPLQDQLSGFYSVATLILSLLIILWSINFIASLISRTFLLGKTLGSFYRNYIHRYIRPFVYGIHYLTSSNKKTNISNL